MKINLESAIGIFLFILAISVILIFYLRMILFNKNADQECEEEHIINNNQKACCVAGKCKIKNI
jgi:hypothetical protein